MMRQVIFSAILTLLFCSTVFAQTNESQKPTKIFEYENDATSENGKIAIDDIFFALQKSSSAEGIIKIQASENKEIVRYLTQIKGLLRFRKVDLTRISFAIRKDDKQIIEYWFVPFGENIADCVNCIIVRAEDYDKLVDFFHPKPKLKKRKK